MGILSDPSLNSSDKKSRYMKIMQKYSNTLCFVLYLAGLAWFGILVGFSELQTKTYFSENALLPGLVLSEMKMDSMNLAKNLLSELEHERISYKTAMPYPWLQAKMKQIGLETFTHNFTLNFPFGGGKTFQGKNIYGILRAARTGSTEAIVLSMPYRPPNTAHTSVTASVPLLLAFADFARRQKYWSKDIIFVISDQEQLGMQAFLEAYYGEEHSNILDSGTLYGKAGNIIAAINFEVQSFDFSFNNLKIEGLNGQLPNLDLHNLVTKLSHKQGIPTGYNSRISEYHPDDFRANLKNLMTMMWTQSSGIPTGNHGLFHRYGIEALTIESVHESGSTKQSNVQQKIMALLRIVEGTSRSLNNLLERFHQSFFFYALVSSERFISIGDYMPSIGLMAGSLLIKSFMLWLISNTKPDETEADQKEPKDEKILIFKKSVRQVNAITVGTVFLVAHLVGVLLLVLMTNKTIHDYFHNMNIPTQTGIFYLAVAVTVLSLITPKFLKFDHCNAQFLHIMLLLELGTSLLSVSMLNFSLGFFLCVGIVPFAIAMNVNNNQKRNLFVFLMKSLLHLLVHPLALVYAIILALSYVSFNEMGFQYIFDKSLKATVDGITYSVVDSMIYGNWLFQFGSLILLPCWVIFWNLNFARVQTKEKEKMM